MGTQRPALLPADRGTTAASFFLISIVTVAKRSPISTTAELLFVSGAIKATILLAHAVFASVNSSDIKNSADLVNIVRNAIIPRHSELTMTAIIRADQLLRWATAWSQWTWA